jgi:hypothetical protein
MKLTVIVLTLTILCFFIGVYDADNNVIINKQIAIDIG